MPNAPFKIVIAGGTGFLGQALCQYFHDASRYHIVVLSRWHHENHDNVQYVYWNGQSLGAWAEHLEGAYALINLAGKSVNCRYTAANKQAIYHSRLQSTEVLGQAMAKVKKAPKVWIQSSSATIYRHTFDAPNTEETGLLGSGFSVDVCRKWEGAATQATLPGVRQVILRTAIVLGQTGGALPVLRRLTKWYLGGAQGNGQQYFSWLHEADWCGIVEYALFNQGIQGVYNAAAPNPVTNKSLMQQLRRTYRRTWGLPQNARLVKLGAKLVGTEAELVLKSRKVVPQRLQQSGYVFQYATISHALSALKQKSIGKRYRWPERNPQVSWA